MLQRTWQRTLLVTHVSVSVGWIGAVVAFIALAMQGLRAEDLASINAAYLSMAWTSCYVLVPFAAAAFLTGILESISTHWGLVRHYWVVIKLALTIGATINTSGSLTTRSERMVKLPEVLTIGANLGLWLHMQPTLDIAAAASKQTELLPTFDYARERLIADACAAVALLLVITALSIFKPRGMTTTRHR